MKKLLLSAIGLSFALMADIQLTPFDGDVPLVPNCQKDMMKLEKPEDRWAVLNADHKLPAEKRAYIVHGDKAKEPQHLWRSALPVDFNWTCTDGETGPFRVEISEQEDFAQVQYLFNKKATTATASKYLANFKIGTKYYWRVWGKKKVDGKTTDVVSQTGTFTTEDQPPRWMAYEGSTANFRDWGGWKTTDGRRVKQGLIFRSQGLNQNSEDGKIPGRKRLTLADQDYALNVLKIKTDLDQRSTGEVGEMKESPLGPTVQFINNPSSAYHGIYSDGGKRAMAKNFRVFCNPDNYPITFHCIGGADRAGSLAWVLKGAAGVSQHDADVDWEHTFYPRLPNCDFFGTLPDWLNFPGLNEGLQKYGKEGDSFKTRIELYLQDCGITMEEIETFRKIILE